MPIHIPLYEFNTFTQQMMKIVLQDPVDPYIWLGLVKKDH